MPQPQPTAEPAAHVFAVVRDTAVAIGRAATALDLDTIDQALAEADRAQAFGPIIDPTVFLRGTDALAEQVKYLRAFRAFRAAIEELRP